jgi:hypothetical protein
MRIVSHRNLRYDAKAPRINDRQRVIALRENQQ